ncbi:nuclease-related domain-containing protein [Pseudofrankia sp. DC12]|uniref:nuclease-related domain-containing protein n=1 Tax=Pseudofrankia sp. DC12 TaxID=683315 RepID=UPI0005F87A34|nr:nuclease-related domain-containing protein [Pseudofrankia sp. DC12]
MREEILSDHGGEQLALSGEQLRSATSNLEAWQDSYYAAQQDLQASRRAKPWWKRVLGVSTAVEREALARTQSAHREVAWADYDRQQIDQRFRQQSAGVQGEQTLAWGLSELDDSWVMLRGYRNRRGETDHVLVGPLGVWMVEVKRRRIRLHVSGDDWWYEKISSRGYVVDKGWAVDGGGRSWSRQVNEIAFELARWLDKNRHYVPIRTAVMIMHDHAVLGDIINPTVSLIGTRPVELLEAMRTHAFPLDEPTCDKIVDLIRRDHKFHGRQRGRSQRR